MNKKLASSIRVNLRFGPRTNPELLQYFSGMAPYRRAKMVRRLLEEGWRARQEEHVPTRPLLTLKKNAGAARPMRDADFGRQVLEHLGKAIKL
jgi:hypothetical protein